MQLRRLRIGGFRGERDLVLEFAEHERVDPALTFLIGPNGAGKSRVLEAVGRIMSHLAGGFSPGLDFDVEYMLGGRRVAITTQPPELDDGPAPAALERVGVWLLVDEGGGDGPWQREHLRREWPEDVDGVLPFRVLGLSTGPTSRLDWALRSALRETLAEAAAGDDVQGEAEEEYEEQQTRRLLAEVESRCIPLSEDELLLAVLALLSHPEVAASDDGVRDELLRRAGIHPRRSLCAFAFVVPPDWRRGVQDAQQPLFENMLDQATRRIALEPESDREVELAERPQRVVFELSRELQDWIGGTAEAPFIWFNQLLGWLSAGALESVRLVMTKLGEDGLLLDYDFSDGEFLFAGRYGLLQLLKGQSDYLVLFDEPETHFNDRWKVDLIFDLERVLRGADAQVMIATHSDLTLSDADRADVHMLALDEPLDGRVEVSRQPPVSPLAASRSAITTEVFGARKDGGRRGEAIVEEALASGDRATMEAALARVGPGYHRLRLEYALDLDDGDAA